MESRSSGPSMFLVAIVAILGIAVVAFVAMSMVNRDGGTDGGGLPLPTIVLPTSNPEPTQSSYGWDEGWHLALQASPAA